MSLRKVFVLMISLSVAFVFLLPYVFSLGRSPVPFSELQTNYSLSMDYQEPDLSAISSSFALTTGSIVNSSYLEVTESIGTGETLRFYVEISNRSVLLSEELLPEISPHGEYYDLWIGEGHRAGDVLKVLNETVTLSASGLKFHGWLFFDTIATGAMPSAFSRTVNFQGTPLLVDYVGEIFIIYDQQTGLMIEDHQSWTANFTHQGSPQTFYYETVLTYESSNVRFSYLTYLLATALYTAIAIIMGSLLFAIIRVMRKRRREQKLFEMPPEPPQTPESPRETTSGEP